MGWDLQGGKEDLPRNAGKKREKETAERNSMHHSGKTRGPLIFGGLFLDIKYTSLNLQVGM